MNKTLLWRLAIQGSRLPSTTRHVLLNLSIHMNNEGKSCFPSTQTQASETGLTERTIITHIDRAVAAGFLKKGIKGRSGKGWALHEYEAVMPHGTEPCAVPKPDNIPQGTEPISIPRSEGAERDDGDALNEVQSNSSRNSTEDSDKYFWTGQVIRLNEGDFRKWQKMSDLGEDALAEYLAGRDGWLIGQPQLRQRTWFVSTQKDLLNRFCEKNVKPLKTQGEGTA